MKFPCNHKDGGKCSFCDPDCPVCIICGEKGYGIVSIGGHVCYVCDGKIKRGRADVAGKNLEDGMKLVRKDWT